jgi:hypothetical protein
MPRRSRDEIVEKLREVGHHDWAIQAECALPEEVDTRRDAGLLHHYFDLDITALENDVGEEEEGEDS